MLGLGGLALAAGVLSITSPCCLPLLPGYLSYMSGVSRDGELQRRRVLGTALLFVLGFGLVFTALGASASLLGSFLLARLSLFLKISGVLIILMGLSMLGVLRLPFLMKEARFSMRKVPRGPAGAVPFGMAFAFGWTPCIGPILASILTAAAATQTAGRGALLLLIYSVGMGIPFVALALVYTKAGRTVGFLKRNGHRIEQVGGSLLVAMGILLIAGQWQRIFIPLIRLFRNSGWPPI